MIIDINYLVWVLRKKGEHIEFVKRYKPYEPITKDVKGITRVEFDSKYISDGFTYEHFQKYNTFVVQGCTGTGKTTAVANHVEQYSTTETKFLSITTRQSLSDQHQKSVEGIGMQNYQDIKTDLYDATSLTICLNSLTKIDALGDDELANYIVYIDEIASFLEFTGNDTLDSVLKRVQVVLMRIVRYAGKIIVSDALINDNVFEFLKHRDIKTTIFLKNNYQMFKDVPAVRIRDETNFLNKLLDHCRDEQPFIFGSDSCDVITKFFHKCRESAPEQHDKFLLITADTNVRVKDASTEWKISMCSSLQKLLSVLIFQLPSPKTCSSTSRVVVSSPRVASNKRPDAGTSAPYIISASVPRTPPDTHPLKMLSIMWSTALKHPTY